MVIYWTDFAEIGVALLRSCYWAFKQGTVERSQSPSKTDELQYLIWYYDYWEKFA